ncbi:hypothetical protein [Sphingobacterium sp. LRF_L2]|uniref:hypothetical protein n=1 Tax=Sphingobacterium sp. LRF_L2 TaxID=3369421 RepID=UPI003F5FEE9A
MHLPVTGNVLLSLIPQRSPIVMVSSLEAYTTTQLTASLFIEKGLLFTDSHALAESGLLEHMAQSVALHTGYSFFLRDEAAPMGYIGAIQHAEIYALPLIGQTIFSEVLILQEFMGVTLVEIITKLGEDIIARAQMKTVIANK